MAEMFKVNAPVRKPLFEGVQGENEARSIVFDITPWVTELGDGAVTATAKRSQDSQPYPVTVTKDGNTVTWKPTSTDTAFAGVGSFQLEYTVDDVLAKTCIWSTMVAPSLDPAGDPPDPYDNWLAEMREIAADAIQAAQDADESADDAQAEVYEAEAWAKGTKNGTPVPSTADQYQNNSKYFAEESYKNAEAWAVGQRGGVDVPSTDPTYENNSKYWAEQSLANQYGAFIVKSASGDIASFADGADNVPMKSVNVAITPKQAGSGDPSPSNVRPITGTSTANVFVTGVNLWDEEWELGRFDTTTGADYPSVSQIRSKNYIPIKPSTEIHVKASPNIWCIFYDENKQAIPSGANPSWYVTSGNSVQLGESPASRDLTVPSNAYFMRFYTQNTYGTTYNNDISINYPSTDTEYHAYNGHTTPVPLGQTVYGGTVDVAEGEGETWNRVDLGTLNYTSITHQGHRILLATLPNVKLPTVSSVAANALCEVFKHVSLNKLGTDADNICAVGTYFGAPNLNIQCSAFDGMSGAEVKQALSGKYIVYEMATPTEITFDPVSVPSLLGTNNVWADCGSVAVEYRADPTLAYAELEALILENL